MEELSPTATPNKETNLELKESLGKILREAILIRKKVANRVIELAKDGYAITQIAAEEKELWFDIGTLASALVDLYDKDCLLTDLELAKRQLAR